MKSKFFNSIILIASGAFLNSCSINNTPNAPAYEGSPLDSGLRSGSDALASEAIDSLLNQKERPGLATGWGDEKKSSLSYSPFKRGSNKPAGTDVIFYNDSEGVDAMTSNKGRVDALQTAAGDMVEWGVKGGVGYLPTYKEYGYGRRLVAGRKGSEYTIVVKNRCISSLEIVTSVDGLDVMDGKTAAFSKRGYIVQPGKTLEIKGFRTSNNSVAAFKFSSVSGSYANLKHGDTRNVGVIGIAVFTQKDVDPWKWSGNEINKRDQAKAFAEAP